MDLGDESLLVTDIDLLAYGEALGSSDGHTGSALGRIGGKGGITGSSDIGCDHFLLVGSDEQSLVDDQTVRVIDLQIARTGRERSCERDAALYAEVVLIVVSIHSVGPAAGAQVGSDRTGSRHASHGHGGDGNEVAGLLETGLSLITFTEPRIDDGAIVESVYDIALGITQGDISGSGSKRGTSVEEIGGDLSLISCIRNLDVKNDLVDRVVGCEGLVKLDRIDKCEHGLVGRMVETGGGLEGDTAAIHAVRHVGRVEILQRLLQVDTGTGILVRTERSVKGVANGRSADGLDRHPLDAVSLAVDVETDTVAYGNVGGGGKLDVGLSGIGVHGQVCLGTGFADLGDGHDLIFLKSVGNGRICGAIADGHLATDGEAFRARHGNVVGTSGDGDDRALGQRLPERGGRAGSGAAHHGAHVSGRSLGSRFVHGSDLHFLASDLDLVSDGDAGDVAYTDDLVTLGSRGCKAGIGQTEQIEALALELGAPRDADLGESGDVDGVLGDGPAGDVNGLLTGIVELDEIVSSAGGGSNAELVDLDRIDAADLLDGLLGTAGAATVSPCRQSGEVTVESFLAGLDIERDHYGLSGSHSIADLAHTVLGAEDGSLPFLGQDEAELEVLDLFTGDVDEGDGGAAAAALDEGLEAIGCEGLVRCGNRKRGHVIAGGHDIGLDGEVGLLGREGAGCGHGTLVEGTGRAVGVVTAVAEQDGALLAHGIVAVARVADAAAVIVDLQAAVLGISAHRTPVMGLAVGESGHETPGDTLESLAILVVRVIVDAAYEVVLLVGHDPRTGSVAMVPHGLVAVVSGLHGTVTVVAAVGLGVAIVEAASGVVMVAVDDPVLAFGLVIHGSALGVVPSIAHTGSDEYAVDLVAVQVHGSPVGKGDVVESSHGRSAESSARSLLQQVLVAGLVVDDCDPAVSVLAELVLRGSVSISAGILGRRLDDADVQGLAVGLAHHLIEGPVIGGEQGAGRTVRCGARVAGCGIDIAGALRALHRVALCYRHRAEEHGRSSDRNCERQNQKFSVSHDIKCFWVSRSFKYTQLYLHSRHF